jgi:hypothetical protein
MHGGLSKVEELGILLKCTGGGTDFVSFDV